MQQWTKWTGVLASASIVGVVAYGCSSTEVNVPTITPPTSDATVADVAPKVDAAKDVATSDVMETMCAPQELDPPFDPANIKKTHVLPGSCTPTNIEEFMVKCFTSYVSDAGVTADAGGTDCSGFLMTTCGACIYPTDMSATTLGALLSAGGGRVRANIPGCVGTYASGAATVEQQCSDQLLGNALCPLLSCQEACPVADAMDMEGQEALEKCQDDALADGAPCANYASNKLTACADTEAGTTDAGTPPIAALTACGQGQTVFFDILRTVATRLCGGTASDAAAE